MTEERQFVEYERKGNIVTIAMNRPEKLNAVSDEVVRQLMTAFREFDADPDAHVAILCGRGRHFAAAPMYISASYAPVRSSSGSAVRKVTARTPAIC